MFCQQCGFTLAGTALFVRVPCAGVYLFRLKAFPVLYLGYAYVYAYNLAIDPFKMTLQKKITSQ